MLKSKVISFLFYQKVISLQKKEIKYINLFIKINISILKTFIYLLNQISGFWGLLQEIEYYHLICYSLLQQIIDRC